MKSIKDTVVQSNSISMTRKLIIEFSQEEFEKNNWFYIKVDYLLNEGRNTVVSSCVFYEGAIKPI